MINIITKSTVATQGGLVSVTRSDRGGTEALRWGGKLGEVGHLRVYALALDRDNTRRADGVERADAASKHQFGFRSDFGLEGGQLTVQGDLYRGGDDPASNLAPKLHGGNLLARWESRFANGSPYRVQAYYDAQSRDETTAFRNDAHTIDVQFTHEPRLPQGQQLLWGAGYRSGRDVNAPSPALVFIPAERTLSWANVFAQHQLQAGAWQLTLGAKVERNSYTGVEFLPSLRVAYGHGSTATTWGALSRAVRAPARIDRDFNFPANPPFQIRGGGEGFVSEVATVAELGHKGQWGRNLSYSATVFRQHYERLRGGAGSPPQVANRIEGDVDGIEAWAQWQPADFARLGLGYLGLHKDLRFSAPPENPNSIASLGNDPRSEWKLRAQFDLPHRLELDVLARRVGALPAPAVPAYTAVDLRLGWQVTPRIELSLLAKNILDERHAEFNAAAVASEFGRRIFLRAVFQL
ncbi:TonB-dependent receptor [Ramlibacter sp. XY19]|nr:TonB-dependent receptor [Ramlibacter paludis]